LQVIEISAFDRYEKVNLQKMSKNKYAPKIKERNDIKDREGKRGKKCEIKF
jgi:hypothetical protein